MFQVRGNTGTCHFDYATLEAAIAKDVNATTTVEDVIKEIQDGNFLTLGKYGITFRFVSSDDLQPPKAGADPATLMTSLDSINILDVLYALREASQKLREAGVVMRHAERDASGVEAVNAANRIRSAAMTSMVFNMISGGVNVAMSVVSLASTASQIKGVNAASDSLEAAQKEVAGLKPGTKLTEAEVKLNTAQATYDKALAGANANSAKMQSINTLLGGATGISEGVGTYLEAQSKAEQAKHEANAQAASSVEAESAEFQKAAEELLASVKETVKETIQAYNQANAAIYRNM